MSSLESLVNVSAKAHLAIPDLIRNLPSEFQTRK